MIQIKTSVDKKAITLMPNVSFQGRIVVVLSESECDKAVAYLNTQKVVGLDTETRPSFAKGKTYKVSLIQISTEEICFLFRLNYIGFPDSLTHFLENGKILKIGLSLRDDFNAMHKRTDFAPQGFVELQKYMKEFGVTDMSLQKIYALLFGEKISKNQRLTNWEADVLSDKQKQYASIDAWACLRIYRYVEERKKAQDYELIYPVPVPLVRTIELNEES